MVILLHKWLIVCCSLLVGKVSEPAVHPLYISISEINHNAADKNLEVSVKIFADDFEKTLAAVNRTKIDLSAPPDKATADKMVAAYVKTHLLIKLDNKPVTLEFVGYEKESDAIWSYFQVANTAAPKKIDVVNSLLFESYDKQINLMHVAVSGNRKSTRLNYPDKEASFSF